MNPRKRFTCAFLLSVGLLSTVLLHSAPRNHWPWVVEKRKHESRPEKNIKALGPLYEKNGEEDTGNESWTAMRPFTVNVENVEGNPANEDDYFLYPLYSRKRTADTDRWNIFHIVRSLKIQGEKGELHKFNVFPFWFSKKTDDPNTSYKGLFPIRGMVRGLLGYDIFSWTLFPLHAKFKRDQDERHSVLWPIFQWQNGPKSDGFAVWPFFGRFSKEGVYDRRYILWPFYYHNKVKLDKKYPEIRSGILPFYSRVSSENVDSWSWLWPFFGYTKQKEPSYDEQRYFWPFFVQGDGQDKKINRWAPFYSKSEIHGKKKTWYMWPLFREMNWQEKEIAITQKQFLYFIAWDQEQQSLLDPDLPKARVSHLWPLYSYRDDGAGYEQVHFLSPFGSLFPHDTVIRKEYTPLFTLYKSEQDGENYARQSMFFDLIVSEDVNESSSFSIGPLLTLKNHSRNEPSVDLLGGLFRLEQRKEGMNLTLFWQDIFKSSKDEGENDELKISEKKKCTERLKRHSMRLARR